MPFDWDPERNLGTCTGALPAPRVAHMGEYQDVREKDAEGRNLQERMRTEGHLRGPANAPMSAAFIVTDQGCHRRVEQFKADGTLQMSVCVLGSLHVMFAFIKCIFETFDPILCLARLVETQLNARQLALFLWLLRLLFLCNSCHLGALLTLRVFRLQTLPLGLLPVFLLRLDRSSMLLASHFICRSLPHKARPVLRRHGVVLRPLLRGRVAPKLPELRRPLPGKNAGAPPPSARIRSPFRMLPGSFQ